MLLTLWLKLLKIIEIFTNIFEIINRQREIYIIYLDNTFRSFSGLKFLLKFQIFYLMPKCFLGERLTSTSGITSTWALWERGGGRTVSGFFFR